MGRLWVGGVGVVRDAGALMDIEVDVQTVATLVTNDSVKGDGAGASAEVRFPLFSNASRSISACSKQGARSEALLRGMGHYLRP